MISSKETKLMRMNTKNIHAVKVDGQEIDNMDGFDYLGAGLAKHGGAGDYIKSHLGKVAAAFTKLAKIWRSGELSKNTKFRLLKSNIIAVLLYGCKTWRMTKKDEVKLDTFLHKYIQRV